VGTQLIGQPLGAQGGKDPLDGVRVRRSAPAGGVVADTQGAQQVLIPVGDPVGDLDPDSHIPDSTAAVHNPKIVESECRTPRLSRESATAAKHSIRPPPPARCNMATRPTSTATATSATWASSSVGTAAGTDMTD